MSLDSIYKELGVDFEPRDRKLYLAELADCARDYQTTLGPDEPTKGRSTQLEHLASELGKESVEFSPRLSVVALTEKLFTDLHLEVPPYIATLFERFKFYLVDFPITLVPRPGGGFSQLDCIVEFNPDSPPAERPVAYQIFPHEEWQEVVHAWQGVSVGVDENLEFKLNPADAVKKLSGLDLPARAAVELKMAANAGLILGPFDYRIRRPKIISRGRGNVKVYWRLESEERVTEEQPRLGVVLQVPKEVSRVDAIGALAASSRKFHGLTSELGHLMNFLSEGVRNFLQRGAPASDKKPWDDITAGV
jgi:hypothetical protein